MKIPPNMAGQVLMCEYKYAITRARSRGATRPRVAEQLYYGRLPWSWSVYIRTKDGEQRRGPFNVE